jgi:hypothetical protein
MLDDVESLANSTKRRPADHVMRLAVASDAYSTIVQNGYRALDDASRPEDMKCRGSAFMRWWAATRAAMRSAATGAWIEAEATGSRFHVRLSAA